MVRLCGVCASVCVCVCVSCVVRVLRWLCVCIESQCGVCAESVWDVRLCFGVVVCCAVSLCVVLVLVWCAMCGGVGAPCVVSVVCVCVVCVVGVCGVCVCGAAWHAGNPRV